MERHDRGNGERAAGRIRASGRCSSPPSGSHEAARWRCLSRLLKNEGSIAVNPPGVKRPAESLTPMDRALLLLEREGNRRLRGLGTALYRLTGGRFTPRDRDVVLLTTRGRISGREHTVLLQAFPDGENMILAAANSGRPAPPDWLLNLRSSPAARVEIMDQTVRVRAEELPEEEAEALWPFILRRAPSYARYRDASGRAIPLVRLVPAGPGEEAPARGWPASKPRSPAAPDTRSGS